MEWALDNQKNVIQTQNYILATEEERVEDTLLNTQ